MTWAEANREYLVAEFARLREHLETKGDPAAQPAETIEAVKHAQRTLKRLGRPAAINRLTKMFELSPFEREVLLLCAGVEMDSALAERCRAAVGHPAAAVTFGLALAALGQPHWSALTPGRPLRRYRLIEIEDGRGLSAALRSLTNAPLRLDERVLHYLAGINLLDPRLESVLQVVAAPAAIAEEHAALAGTIAPVFAGEVGVMAPATLVHLSGNDPQGRQDVAALAAMQAGRHLYALRAEEIPADGDAFLQLWSREAALLDGVLLVECEAAGQTGAGQTAAARRLMERVPGYAVVSSRDPVQLSRVVLRYEVNKPQPAEQRRLWAEALGPAAATMNGFLDKLAEQFRLSAQAIHATGSMNREATPAALWKACSVLARPRLEDLAERIVPAAVWEDLVLPEAQKQVLQQIVTQVSCRMKVYETWGFAAKGRRGLGISALFAGESGTGKTLAAEVLASALGLDLYRIDLSAIVSKYIGETEKNLRQVFDAAEGGGVLLLFDEADALFGKRSEVKDSHDRYANIEVGYLLQRMESYQGLAVLTSNLKSSIDRSFQRRLRFIVNFPFPDVAQREAIWSRAFPAATPVTDLKPAALAQLKVPGGNIRNIAMNAAFLAAEEKQPVAMAHLLRAAQIESLKTERPLSEAETRGWV